MHRTRIALPAPSLSRALIGGLGLLALTNGRGLAVEPHPPITLSAAVNRAGEARGNPDRRIFVFRKVGNAIQQKVWSSADEPNGSWSQWLTYAQSDVAGEPSYGTSMAAWAGEFLDPGWGVFLPRFGAALNYVDAAGQKKTGRPFSNFFEFARFWEAVRPPATGTADDLQPYTSFTWQNGQALRVNVFGLAPRIPDPTTGQTLRETWFDGATWRFTEHGAPSGTLMLRVGPHSAVWMNPTGNGRGWVFATGDNGRLHARTWNGAAWSWEDLGAPSGVYSLRTPVAVQENGRVHVYASGQTPTGYRLYERRWNGASWEGWRDWGPPPAGTYPMDAITSCPQRPTDCTGFDLTAAAVWRTSSGQVRYNVFGTTDRLNRLSSGLATHDGGQLVEISFDGALRWGNPIQNPQRLLLNLGLGGPRAYPLRVQVTDVEVVDAPFWERIAVFVKDESGGDWEYVWNGQGWSWARL